MVFNIKPNERFIGKPLDLFDLGIPNYIIIPYKKKSEEAIFTDYENEKTLF